MNNDIQTIQQKLTELKNATHYENEETQESLDIINEIFLKHNGNKTAIQEIWRVMSDLEFLATVVKIWKQLYSIDNEVVFMNFESQRRGSIYISMKKVIWNYSDQCYDLCKACYSNGSFISLLMKELKIFATDLSKLNDSFVRYHVKATLGILHNLVRQYEFNHKQIEANHGLETLACYISAGSNYLIVRAVSHIILAYCSHKEGDYSQLPATEVCHFMLDQLRTTLFPKTDTDDDYCLSSAEVTEAITKLAENDKNKKEFIDGGILKLIVGTLENKTLSDDVILSLRCIWALTQYDYSRKAIIQEQNFIKKIEHLNKEGSEEVKKICANILDVLCSSGIMPVSKHIMISYQWDHQVQMMKVYEYLVGEGFKVWMDIHKMRGSILSCMSEAVRNSDIVIMAVTKKYEEGHAPKQEAEYANHLEKIILPLKMEPVYDLRDWLGPMLAGKLYVDLSDRNPESNYEDIKKQIFRLVPDIEKS